MSCRYHISAVDLDASTHGVSPLCHHYKKKAKTKNHHQQQSDTKTNQKNSIKPTQEKNNVPRLSYAQL